MVFTYTFSYFLITVVCSCIALIIIFQININMGSEQEVKSFRNYVGWYLGFLLSNMVWVWINYGYLEVSGMYFSILNLISICVASYYWFKYVETRLSADFVKNRSFHIVSLLPLCIAILLVLSTPVTKWVFYYNEKNEYIHGPLYPTMFLLAVSYLLFATVHLITKVINERAKSKKREYIVLAVFLVFPVAAGLLDIVAENLPIMELALLFGTILVYTNLLQSRVFFDSLTQLNNRRSVDSYLAQHISQSSESNPLYFFMSDIDNFKQINDAYGHLEGDKVLVAMGRALLKYTEASHNYAARWGGDEFCVIATEHATDPEKIISDIQRYVYEESKGYEFAYDVKLSIGYARCISPLTSPEKLIDVADKMLYERKPKAIKNPTVV